jgi:hypothetical protein
MAPRAQLLLFPEEKIGALHEDVNKGEDGFCSSDSTE